MKRFACFLSLILAMILIVAAVPFVNAAPALPADLQDPGAWYYSDAVFCYTFSIMVGDEFGNFNPMKEISRAELVTIMARLLYPGYEDMSDEAFGALLNTVWAGTGSDPFELPPVSFEEDLPYFADTEGKWFERGATLMAAAGVVSGRGDGTFDGEAPITRQELAVLLKGAINNEQTFGESKTFSDLDAAASWAHDAVVWAGTCGLFQGSEGKFMPLNKATRAEIAVLIGTFRSVFLPDPT